MGTVGGLTGKQRIALGNVLREDRRILAQGQATERRNDGTGIQDTK